ncbi:MAG: SMI1/KNR4 family protein [Alphaproteobacteria bacterium]|nr:SMI1/KNR4 family protein [Alphaproteobacteria bacterium]
MSWKRIQAWEKAHLPKAPRKRRGATKAVADQAIAMGLPEDYVARMRETDGSDSPVFGRWRLYALGEVPEAWRNLQEWSVVGGAGVPTGPVRPVYLSPRWFPIGSDIDGDRLCLDLDPADGGHVGQLVEFLHDDSPRRVVATSFTAWLDSLADDLETGRMVWDVDLKRVTSPATAPGPRATWEAVAERALEVLADDEGKARLGLPRLGVLGVHYKKGFTLEFAGRSQVVRPVRALAFWASEDLLAALNPGVAGLRGPKPASSAWLEGLDTAALAAGVLDSIGPTTKAMALPGLGRLKVVTHKQTGERRVVLEAARTARDRLNP